VKHFDPMNPLVFGVLGVDASHISRRALAHGSCENRTLSRGG